MFAIFLFIYGPLALLAPIGPYLDMVGAPRGAAGAVLKGVPQARWSYRANNGCKDARGGLSKNRSTSQGGLIGDNSDHMDPIWPHRDQ